MKCACAILSSVACPTLRYFFILFHKEHDFRKNKLNVKCGFWVSLQILSATFLIRRRIKQDIIINVYWSSMYSYLSDFNENWIFWTDFRKKFKCQILQKSVQWEPSCSMRTNRHANGLTGCDEADIRFSQFCEHTKYQAASCALLIYEKGL